MARRPDPVEFDQPLGKEELQALARRLGMLSQPGLIDAYRRAYQSCAMAGDRVPRAGDVQEMVTAWKLMRAWAKRRPVERG